MRILLVLIGISLAANTLAQNYIGTDFRFAFLRNTGSNTNGDPNFDISVQGFQDAFVTIEFGNPGDDFYLIETFNIANDQTVVESFNQIFLNQINLDVVESRSFHITSTGNIRVFIFFNRVVSSEASPVLPTSELGNEYTVLTIDEGTSNFSRSLLTVVASEDNTVVDFLPTAPSVYSLANEPFSLTLDAGEVITISSTENLTGSTVSTDPNKPIAVFAGHQNTAILGCPGSSHVFEQIPPENFWSDVHVITPVAGNGGDLVRIIARNNGTVLSDGCDEITTINAGQVHEDVFTEPFVLNSSTPVLVAMFTQSMDCADLETGTPNMRIVAPLDRANTNVRIGMNSSFQNVPAGGSTIFLLSIVMPTDDINGIEVNGQAVDGWEPILNYSGLSYASYEINDISDQYLSIQSTAPFWADYVSLAPDDAMTMGLGSTTTMEIPEIDEIEVDLGEDFSICGGTTVVLDPGLGLEGNWQDNSFQETFEVTEPGVYSVAIQGLCEVITDEVVVSQGELPEIDLPESYTACEGGSIEIGVDPVDGASYVWENSEDGPTITVADPGIYTITASLVGGCEASAETEVMFTDTPFLEINGPSAMCAGGSEELVASSNTSGTYEWTDGTANAILTIDQPGTYEVSFSDDQGCATSEDFTVGQAPGPDVMILGPDELCDGQEATLTAIGDPGTFEWEDGTVGDELSISNPGFYRVILTGNDACQSEGIYRVDRLDLPKILVEEFLLCEGESVDLVASSFNSDLVWPDLSDGPIARVEESGIYIVQGENTCGISTLEVVVESEDCSCKAYIPNAFTPDGDGLNDLFKPVMNCRPTSYELSIFNRWGELVFNTNEPEKAWNGSSVDGSDYYGGVELYAYILTYDNPLRPLEETEVYTGTVSLIR